MKWVLQPETSGDVNERSSQVTRQLIHLQHFDVNEQLLTHYIATTTAIRNAVVAVAVEPALVACGLGATAPCETGGGDGGGGRGGGGRVSSTSPGGASMQEARLSLTILGSTHSEQESPNPL